jgi:hypothetical protein
VTGYHKDDFTSNEIWRFEMERKINRLGDEIFKKIEPALDFRYDRKFADELRWCLWDYERNAKLSPASLRRLVSLVGSARLRSALDMLSPSSNSPLRIEIRERQSNEYPDKGRFKKEITNEMFLMNFGNTVLGLEVEGKSREVALEEAAAHLEERRDLRTLQRWFHDYSELVQRKGHVPNMILDRGILPRYPLKAAMPKKGGRPSKG